MTHTAVAAVASARLLASLLAFFFMVASAGAADVTEIKRAAFAETIGARPVAFAAHDLENGQRYRLEGSDTSTRHAPWSTFKIANLVIALETGVARSLADHRRWDRARRPARRFWPDAWRRDHTLRTAFEASAVWYFRDIALGVGAARYRSTLSGWRYGNAHVPNGADGFWLGGSLMISVDEQVRFLGRLIGGDLAVSRSSLRALAEASRSGGAGGVSLHGKTGAGPVVANGRRQGYEGWYAGFVLREGRRPVVFALYTQDASLDRLRGFRKGLSVQLLQAIGVLPGQLAD